MSLIYVGAIAMANEGGVAPIVVYLTTAVETPDDFGKIPKAAPWLVE